MENAANALLMAGGMLIGILILSLAVYLYASFGAQGQQNYEQIAQQQLIRYNAQYTVYSGRSDLSVYDVVSIITTAYSNNQKYKDYSTYKDEYQVEVMLGGQDYASLTNYSEDKIINLIQSNNDVESYKIPNTDEQYDVRIVKKYKCSITAYNEKGKVSVIKIE